MRWSQVVERGRRYKEYYCMRVRATLRAQEAVCVVAQRMNTRRAHGCWGVCDAQGKFQPIHSDDWKETGQENQMLVADPPRSIQRNPLLHLNAPSVHALYP